MTTRNVSTWIDEDELRAVLSDAAERYAVPPEGANAIRVASRRHETTPDGTTTGGSWAQSESGPHRTRRITLALGAIAAAVVLALLVGSISRTGRSADTASPSDRASGVSTTTPQATLGGSERSGPATTAVASARAPSTGGAPGSSADALSKSNDAPSSSASSATSPARADPGSEKIVKTGSLDLEVPRRTFSDRVNRLTSVAKGLGGFVAETGTSEQDVTPTGTIALRVPVNRFEDLLVQARRLGRVRSATSAAQDVTSEYTDITGRLKTMTDERSSLELVLTDAKNVPDILAVRDRLNSVQAEIEQLQGRRNVLDDQTALATLTVSLREPGPIRPPPHPPTQQSGLSDAWRRAVDGFTGGVESIVASSGKVLLVALCAAAVWWLGRPIWHRLRHALV